MRVAAGWRRRHRNLEQQVGGVLHVILDAPGEAVTEQPEIDTSVVLGRLLPLEIRVLDAGRDDARLDHVAPGIGRIRAALQLLQRGIGLDPGIALPPPADTQAQV